MKLSLVMFESTLHTQVELSRQATGLSRLELRGEAREGTAAYIWELAESAWSLQRWDETLSLRVQTEGKGPKAEIWGRRGCGGPAESQAKEQEVTLKEN